MRIRFEFSLSEPISLSDKWPIDVGGTIFSFMGPLHNTTGICATLLGQSLNFAPQWKADEKPPTIVLRHGQLLPTIAEKIDRLQCTIGMLLPVEVDTRHYRVYFEPENQEEETKIPIKNWGEERRRHNNRISFDMAAKGLLTDPWPKNDLNAAQFYRRARAAINAGYFVDAFVNYYFFLERLYAEGKFKTAQVVKLFSSQADIQKAFAEIIADASVKRDASSCGAPLDQGIEAFCEWLVNRRGFFQHQSETDPNRWLHSDQEKFKPEAFVLAEFVMAVYNARYIPRIFAEGLNKRWVEAATKARAIMEIVVEVLGDDAEGAPARKRIGVNGPGTHVTAQIARDVLMSAMEFADRQLISVRQITATVKGTNELVFLYTGPAAAPSDQQVDKQ